MQFQVPQFIETEDKIIGPLTLRQFFYIAGGLGLCFTLYFTVQLWLFVVISAFILGLTIALAFVKVNGKGLPGVLLSAFNFYWHPQTYVWQPDQPALPKTDQTMKSAGGGFSLEKVVAGFALKNAWRYLQTGSKAPEEAKLPVMVEVKTKETYQVVRELTGERRVARRIDYR